MTKKKHSRYLVRNRLHQIVGDFSEEEIVRQIRQGKFTGDEEAVEPPSTNWKHLSSWPEFYDVLIGQALNIVPQFQNKQLENESEEALESLGGPPRDVHTFGGETAALDSNKEEGAVAGSDSTQQLGTGSESVIAKSEIEALFSSQLGLSNPSAKELGKPIDDLKPSELAAAAPVKEGKNPQTNRRVLIFGGVLALLLALYQLGDSNSPSDKQGSSASEKEVLSVGEVAMDSADQEIFFSKSAEQALQMDSPYGYRAAADYFQKALELKPKEIALYDGATIALARMLEEEPGNETAKTLLKKYLNAGRALEPQRTVFYRAEAISERALGEIKKAQALLDAAVETDSLNPENLLLQAEWFLKDQNYSEAKRVLESVLNWSPQSIKASALLAESYYLLNELDKAQALAQKILQINPTHTESYVLIGNVLAKRNDLKGAKAIMSLAAKFVDLAPKKLAGRALWRMGNLMELGPNSEEARLYYVLSLKYSNEFEEPILSKLKTRPEAKDFEDAKKEILAGPPYFERLGTEAIEEKNFERAEGLYLASTWLFPNISKLWQRLGESREALARTREEFRWAAVTYANAIQVGPENVEALVRLGLLETEQSNLNRAFEVLQKAAAISLEEDPAVHLALGKHLFSRKDYKAAIDQLRLARQKSPSNPEISYYQGLLYKLFDPANPKSAMRHFEEAFSKDPNTDEALAEWLKLKVVTFEKMFAVKFMRNMVASEPKNPKLLWVFGELYAANKEFNRAIQYYQKALDIDKTDSKIRLSLAKALTSVGRLDEAVYEYKLASDLDAKNGEGYFLAAEILYQLQNYNASRDLLLGLLKVIPSYPGARRLLAMSYQATNERDQAIEEMTKEVKANPMNYQFLLELADLLFINNRPTEAEKELSKITNLPIETSVKDSRAPSGYRKEPTGLKGYRTRGLLLLSRLYRATNRTEAAEGVVQSGLQLDPSNLDLLLERAYVYKGLGRYREAAIDFNEFLNKNPNAREAAEVRQDLQRIAVEE